MFGLECTRNLEAEDKLRYLCSVLALWPATDIADLVSTGQALQCLMQMQMTALTGCRADPQGITGILGQSPRNLSDSSSHFEGTSHITLGGFESYVSDKISKGQRLRVVGLDSEASCTGITYIGVSQ